MKTLLLATTLLGNFFNYTAESPFGQPKYEQIREKFQTGTQPEFGEVVGWWSGNCYKSLDSDEAEGTLLAAVEKKWEEKSWWPWADPTTHIEKYMAFIVSANRSDLENHYDNMPDDERYQVKEFLESHEYKSNLVLDADGSIDSGVYGRTVYSVRKSGENFYGITWDSVEVNKGKIDFVCSFHKKVN